MSTVRHNHMSTYREKLAATLNGRGYSNRTVESYVMWLDKLTTHFPGKSLPKLQPTDINGFLQFLQERRFSEQSVKSAKAAIKFIFKDVLPRPEIISSLPKSKRSKADPFIPAQRDVLAILSLVEDKTLHTAFGCLYGMGLELLEVINIKIKHLDLANWKIKIRPKRTQKARLSAIPVCLRENIRFLSEGKAKEAYLFAKVDGAPLYEQKLQRVWAEARDKVGAPKSLTMRSLRHAYVMHLTALGFQLGDVLFHLGYNRASALEYYCRTSDPAPEMYSPLDKRLDEQPHTEGGTLPYVSEQRIAAISALKSSRFDYSKLAQILMELNFANLNSCTYSVAYLLRAIIDHIPPLFGCEAFSQVASNYAGTKSFKKSMEQLQNSLRNISDGLIHTQIRAKEDTPTKVQVDFRNQLDQLLGEIIRISAKNV